MGQVMFEHAMVWWAGLWPIVGHYSFWVVSTAVCAAIVWLRPALWKPVAMAAAVITAGTICYAFGVNDGKRHGIAMCNLEKELAIEGAKRAKANAKRVLAKPAPRGLPDYLDRKPDCRDC